MAGEASKDGQIRLLVPRGTYSPSAELHMHVHDREYLLTPRDLIVAGTDYQIAGYSPAPKDQDAV